MSNCVWCGKPRATAEDWDRYEGGEGAHLCWADPQCELDGDEEIVAALRAENERLREALRHAARELAYVAMYEEVGGPDLVHTSEGDAVIALAEKLLGPMATWPEEPNAGMRAFLAGGKSNV